MSDTNGDVRSLGERLKGEDQGHYEDAARELLNTYGRLVHRHAAHQMSPRLRGRVGIEDVEQEVWLRFVVGIPDTDFSGAADLTAFLRTLVGWVVHDVHRKNLGPTHFPKTKVVPFDQAADEDEATFAARDPSPEEIVDFEDELQRIVTELPCIEQVLVLVRQGYALKAIASQLGLSQRTLHRRLRHLRQELAAAWRGCLRVR